MATPGWIASALLTLGSLPVHAQASAIPSAQATPEAQAEKRECTLLAPDRSLEKKAK